MLRPARLTALLLLASPALAGQFPEESQEVFLVEGHVLVEDAAGNRVPLERGSLRVSSGHRTRSLRHVEVRDGMIVIESTTPEPPFGVDDVRDASPPAALAAETTEFEFDDGRLLLVLRAVEPTRIVAREWETEARLEGVRYEWLDPQIERNPAHRMPGHAKWLQPTAPDEVVLPRAVPSWIRVSCGGRAPALVRVDPFVAGNVEVFLHPAAHVMFRRTPSSSSAITVRTPVLRVRGEDGQLVWQGAPAGLVLLPPGRFVARLEGWREENPWVSAETVFTVESGARTTESLVTIDPPRIEPVTLHGRLRVARAWGELGDATPTLTAYGRLPAPYDAPLTFTRLESLPDEAGDAVFAFEVERAFPGLFLLACGPAQALVRLPASSADEVELAIPAPAAVTFEAVQAVTDAPIEGGAHWSYDTVTELGWATSASPRPEPSGAGRARALLPTGVPLHVGFSPSPRDDGLDGQAQRRSVVLAPGEQTLRFEFLPATVIELVAVGPDGAAAGWVTVSLKRAPEGGRLLSRAATGRTDDGRDVHALVLSEAGRYTITVGAADLAEVDIEVEAVASERVRRVVELPAKDDL